jgi:hypothetical protein
MITERTLRKWRKEALLAQRSIRDSAVVDENWTEPILNRYECVQIYGKILRMTQELLDQHLLRREK